MKITTAAAFAAALLMIGSALRLPGEMSDKRNFTLQVINESPEDADIYAVNGLVRQGIVHLFAEGRAEVEIGEPWMTFGEIVFYAEGDSSGGTYMTPAITVARDARVEMTLRRDMSTSSYRVIYPAGMDETLVAERN